MNRIILLSFALLSMVKLTLAQKFTAGNLVVYRAGDGVAGLRSVATYAFLDEYTPTGTLVRSIKLPGLAAEATAPNLRVTISGSSTSEGAITRSVNGLYIIAEGYNADTGTVGIAKTTAAAVNRVVATVNVNSVINSSNATPSFSGGNNFRGATSVDGNSFYLAGAATGLAYMPVQAGGIDSAIKLSTTVTNIRSVAIFGGQLYVSTGSGTAIRVGSVGTGLPTTTGQTITNLPGVTLTKSSPNQFFIASLPGGQVLYIADDSAGIRKYSLVGGNWVANDSLKITTVNSGFGFRGLTGIVQGNNVGLYATYSSSIASGICAIADNTGFNASILTAVAVPIATAAANTAFRGIAWSPVASPLPIHLTNFNAALQNNKVLVSWIMDNESGERMYEVEKSNDGKSFSTFNTVTPLNNGSSKYAISDANFNVKATAYYRLKVTDNDGKITYSTIAVVNGNVKPVTISVYPNPAADFLVVNHPVANNGVLKIHRIDGTLLSTQKVNDGNAQTYISVNNLAKGNYAISYSNEQQLETVLFNKL